MRKISIESVHCDKVTLCSMAFVRGDMVALFFKQGIAESIGDWYFDREDVKAIDCAYPCDNTCHNLVFK